MKNIKLKHLVLSALLACCCVVLIDLCTNEIDTSKYSWDFKLYIEMARHGFVANVKAPFAYRYGATIPVHLMYSLLDVSIHDGFKLLAYSGAAASLFLVYYFMRFFGFSHVTGLLGLLVVALSRAHVKYLQFDVYRPDHLAYPLMLLAMILVFQKKWFAAAIVSVLGLQIREFLVIPPLVLLVQQVMSAFSEPSKRARCLLRSAVISVVVGLAIVLPRLLIDVEGSIQRIDPFNNPGSLTRLFSDPLNIRKNINFTLSLLTYILPSLLMVTLDRLRYVWHSSQDKRLLLCSYSFFVLVMALYGGSDYNRFMTYLFIPQIVFLGLIFDTRPRLSEVIYMFVALVFINKIFLQVPIWDFNLYLDDFGGWRDRVNFHTLNRFMILLVAIVGAIVMRKIATRGQWIETKQEKLYPSNNDTESDW